MTVREGCYEGNQDRAVRRRQALGGRRGARDRYRRARAGCRHRSKGRTALHIACAVDPKGDKLGEKPAERDGTKTAAALLAAGAELEAFVPMDQDEGTSFSH